MESWWYAHAYCLSLIKMSPHAAMDARRLQAEHGLLPTNPRRHNKVVRCKHRPKRDYLIGMAGVDMHMLGDELWCWYDIVVDEQDQVTGGVLQSSIARCCHALVWLRDRAELQRCIQRVQILVGAIVGSVGDDDDLKIIQRVILTL